jgi:hypothetical protein
VEHAQRSEHKLNGSEERRVALLADESDVHPRLIRLALDYAAEHSEEVRARIERNRPAAERSLLVSRESADLLA